jgi:hypothetical protein
MKQDKPFKPFNGELLDEKGYPAEEFLSWLKNMPLDNVMRPCEVLVRLGGANQMDTNTMLEWVGILPGCNPDGPPCDKWQTRAEI